MQHLPKKKVVGAQKMLSSVIKNGNINGLHVRRLHILNNLLVRK